MKKRGDRTMKISTKMMILASTFMSSSSITAGEFKIPEIKPTYRKGNGTAFTKGKRHKSKRERSRRRKC